MTWDIYMYIIRVTYLVQGEKTNASSLIGKKVKQNKTKTNGAEIAFNIEH